MPNGFIGQHGSRQIAHDLMHFDQDLPGVLLVESNRFHMRTNFAPLLCPVGADFFRSVDEAAFERPRPLHVGSHEGQGGINVARVESRVGGTEQFGFWCRLVWHKNDFSAETLQESAECSQISRLPWDVFVLPTGEPPGWPVPAEQRYTHRLAGALLNRFRACISVEICLREA